jgi:hypothetical protein
METLSPLANAPEIAPVVADRARAASALVRPEPSAIAATKSDLFIFLSLVFFEFVWICLNHTKIISNL